MKMVLRSELWEGLRVADLVKGEVPSAVATPWFVRLMLGIAGWIGASFIMGFVFGLFPNLGRDIGIAILTGAVCCLGAWAIFLFAPNSSFAGQLGLAIGLVGQVLFCVAIFRHFSVEEFLGYGSLFCLEVVLTLVMRNFIQRIFTTLAAVAALFLGFAQSGLHELALPVVVTGCALVWRGEMRLAKWAVLWQPVGYGLALGALFCAAALRSEEVLRDLTQRGDGGWLHGHGEVVGTVLIAVVFLAVTVDILRKIGVGATSRDGLTVLACTVLILGGSFPAYHLAPALLVLVIGFGGGNRILFGLGLLALAAFLSIYYYQMQETLQFKAMILAETGSLLLVGRWGLGKLFPVGEEAHHA